MIVPLIFAVLVFVGLLILGFRMTDHNEFDWALATFGLGILQAALIITLVLSPQPVAGQELLLGNQCPGQLTKEHVRAVRLTATGCDVAIGISAGTGELRFDGTLLVTHLMDWRLDSGGKAGAYFHRPGTDRRVHGAAVFLCAGTTWGPTTESEWRPAGIGLGFCSLSGTYTLGATPMYAFSVPFRFETPRVDVSQLRLGLRVHVDAVYPRPGRWTVLAEWSENWREGFEDEVRDWLFPVSAFITVTMP